MSFEITILGSRSALPIKNHFPTAQVLQVRERLFLIDCGEGCQMQLLRAGLSLLRIDAVFISHLHGDHLFGLFGLLSTMSMLGRMDILPIYAPAPMDAVLRDHLHYFGDGMTYQPAVRCIPTDSRALIYENKAMTVETVPLRHRIPASGFLFREKMPLRNVHRHLVAHYKLPISAIIQLKNGEDITLPDGERLDSETMTYLPYMPCAYAYCSDTLFSEAVIEAVRGVDLLYHEATFQSDRAELAKQTMHSTAADAATVAREAGVKKLLIGHFSSRYPSSEGFLHEAQAIFPDTEIGEELMTYKC
ncbi:MAG: ribonuclease Z [Prevotellaceae bacterium]|jgi:ribonuclease Z|nr:ribonuclease Z [Prevotellaceae bacterium]